MYIKNHYRITAQHHHLRLRRNLESSCGVLLMIFLLSVLTLLPVEAYSQCNETGDIPFNVSNNVIVDNQPLDLCIQCTGPWARASDVCFVKGGVESNEFYAASETIFSPFGKWNCKAYLNSTGMGQNCDIMSEAPSASQDFCLTHNPFGPSVFIDMVTVPNTTTIKLNITGNTSNTPCSPSVVSFLGDNSKQERLKRDKDLFYFTGTAGDEVMLTLEANPDDGNNGGEASLGLTGESLNEATNGNLPLEINATLPADGVYSISVEQPRNPAGLSYRGGYNVLVDSQAGVDLIEPDGNVEK
jgi:hypothetical protein